MSEVPDGSDDVANLVRFFIESAIRAGFTQLAKSLADWFKNHPEATKKELVQWMNEQVSIPESVVGVLNADDPTRKKKVA